MKWKPVIRVNVVTLWKIYKWVRKNLLRKKVQNRRYGYKRDDKDERDYTYKTRRMMRDLPVTTNRKNVEEFQIGRASCRERV